MASFGATLKEYRLDKEWSLQQVADLTGFPTGTISRIENERVNPLETTMRKIRKTLPGFPQTWDAVGIVHIDKKVK